jgi:hypothetical protein
MRRAACARLRERNRFRDGSNAVPPTSNGSTNGSTHFVVRDDSRARAEEEEKGEGGVASRHPVATTRATPGVRAHRVRVRSVDRFSVPEEGLEPSRPYGRRILNPLRLPFRHSGSRADAWPTEAPPPWQAPSEGNVDEHCEWRLSRAPMPSSLRVRLNELAASFSAGVLDAIRGASLEELLSESSGGKSRAPSRAPVRTAPARSPARTPTRSAAPAPVPAPAPATRGRKSGRLARRSAGDISQAVNQIVDLLKSSPAGLRAEQIRQKLGLQAKELPRPLKEGLDGGLLSKVGQKRATTYFAGATSSARKVASTSPSARRGRAPVKRGAAPAKKSRRGKAKKAA